MHFTEERGFMFHGIGGQIVVPLVALALLIVAFFARIPGGVQAALVVLALVVLQVILGMVGHEVPWLGALHALNAFLIFGAGLAASRRAKLAEPMPSGAVA
jgi:heme A synthase